VSAKYSFWNCHYSKRMPRSKVSRKYRRLLYSGLGKKRCSWRILSWGT